MKTLEEKFVNADINSAEFAWMDINGVKECVDIAEEFAIGFGEFCKNLTYANKDILRKNPDVTTKELLEIYKKEKGL